MDACRASQWECTILTRGRKSSQMSPQLWGWCWSCWRLATVLLCGAMWRPRAFCIVAAMCWTCLIRLTFTAQRWARGEPWLPRSRPASPTAPAPPAFISCWHPAAALIVCNSAAQGRQPILLPWCNHCTAGCCLWRAAAHGAPPPTATGQMPSRLPPAPCFWRAAARSGAEPAGGGNRGLCVPAALGRCLPMSCCASSSWRQSPCMLGGEVLVAAGAGEALVSSPLPHAIHL